MRHIFVYGDSLTWGLVPNTRLRLPFEARWPGVLEGELNRARLGVRITEDALNGRRTVRDDPFKAGRNGHEGLAQRMEIHSPLDLVILMLGTNDFQFCHPYNNAWAAAEGIRALVTDIRNAPIEPGMPVPPVLVIAPPAIREPKGAFAQKFAGAEMRCAGIAAAYRELSAELGCGFFDAGSVTQTSEIDGVHLDAEQQLTLGRAVAVMVREMLDA